LTFVFLDAINATVTFALQNFHANYSFFVPLGTDTQTDGQVWKDK